MAVTKALGTTGNGVGVVTPIDHKMAQSALFTKTTTANLIRPGVLYNGTASLVVGRATMSYDVLPFTAALTRGASAGTVILSNDGTVTVNTTAAPGSNSRIDVIYVWAREFSIDGVDSNPVIGVVQGTAAASPTVPSLAAFPGAIELARVTVPAGVTATNSGTTFTQTAPFTSTDGGVVTFRTATEMNAVTNLVTNTFARIVGDQSIYRFNGTTWVGVIEDTGWITPTLLNSWTSVVGFTVQYRRMNGVVYMRGRATGGTTAAIFNLPAGFRSSVAAFYTAQNGTTVGSVTQVGLNNPTSGDVGGVSGSVPWLQAVPPFIAEA